MRLRPSLLFLLCACAGDAQRPPRDARDGNTRDTRDTRGEPVLLVSTSSGAASSAAPAPPREPAPLISPPVGPDPEHIPALSGEERDRADHLQRFVRTAAKKHQVEANLINAVIYVESRFTPRARGRLGPRGVMQVMPRTARAMARELRRSYQPYSADFNIDAGTLYLAKMIELYDGDVTLGLAAYAAGPGTVRDARLAGAPLPERTQAYVRSVLRAKRSFDARGLE